MTEQNQSSPSFTQATQPASSASSTIKLAESSLLIGLGTVLSLIAIINLPFGGSITLFSMVPIAILSYRYGVKWGLFSALVYAFLQMIIGITNLSYGTSLWSKISIILFDYLIAFTALGLAGVFRGKFKNQTKEIVFGTVIPIIIRYLCHVFAGATVWVGLSIPSKQALAFSFIYNASYMIPEAIVTLVGLMFISNIFNLTSNKIVRKGPSDNNSAKVIDKPDLAILFSTLSKIVATTGFIAVVASVFAKLQSEKDGFNIELIKEVNFFYIAIIAVVTAAFFTLFHFLAKSVPKDSTVNLNRLSSKLPYLVVALLIAFNAYLIISTVTRGNFSPKDTISIVVMLSISIIISFIMLRSKTKK